MYKIVVIAFATSLTLTLPAFEGHSLTTNTINGVEVIHDTKIDLDATEMTATILNVSPQLTGDYTISSEFVDKRSSSVFVTVRIGNQALANHRGMTSASVPSTVLEIGDYAFSNCTALSSVELGSNLRRLGFRPFVNTAIRSITLPDSLLDMDSNIAAGTLYDLKVDISDSSHFFTDDTGALYNRDKTKLYACPPRIEGEFILPSSVSAVGADTFFGCFRLTSIILPESITKIGRGAFNVSGIWPQLTAPESTAKLKTIAFASAEPPEAPEDIFEGAPDDLAIIAPPSWPDTWKGHAVIRAPLPAANGTITDENGVTWAYTRSAEGITLGAFDEYPVVSANAAGEIVIPAEIDGIPVTTVPAMAFAGCGAVTKITIPASVSDIAANAFNGCTSLVEIAVAPANLSFASRNKCLYSKDGKALVKVPAKFPFAMTATQTITSQTKDIIQVVGLINETTGLRYPDRYITTRILDSAVSTRTYSYIPPISVEEILSGVSGIGDYAFSDCGNFPANSTVPGTLITTVDGLTTTESGLVSMPAGTATPASSSTNTLQSSAGFYNDQVCFYKTLVLSETTCEVSIPLDIPLSIRETGAQAFSGAHFTEIATKSTISSGETSQKPATKPVAEPKVPLAISTFDSNTGAAEPIKEGMALTFYAGVPQSLPITLDSEIANGKFTLKAKGLPAGFKLAKTTVKDKAGLIIATSYAIVGAAKAAVKTKQVTVTLTNSKNEKASFSFTIQVIGLPVWATGEFCGIAYDMEDMPSGTASAKLSTAGKLTGKVLTPSEDGLRGMTLLLASASLSNFEPDSQAFSGSLAVKYGQQKLNAPFTLRKGETGLGEIEISLPSGTVRLVQNGWARKGYDAPRYAQETFTLESGLICKIGLKGKITCRGKVPGDDGRLVSVSAKAQLLNEPFFLLYVPPKRNLLGGVCELITLP